MIRIMSFSTVKGFTIPATDNNAPLYEFGISGGNIISVQG
jgi:hypothetical protein